MGDISRKAFEVYRDEFVRHVVTKNKEIEAKNTSMEPAKVLFYSVRIHKPSTVEDSMILWKEFNLLDEHEDTETHLVYHEERTDITIPIEQLWQLRVKVSGYPVKTRVSPVHISLTNPPLMDFDHEDEIVRITYHCSPVLSLAGEITNFSGSLEEVQNLIDSYGYLDYFQRFLRVEIDPTTGLPVRLPVQENCLNGSIMVLRKIKIFKETMSVQSLPYKLRSTDTNNDHMTDIFLQELDFLAKLEYGKCQEVKLAALKRSEVLMKNALLHSTWAMLQTFHLMIYRFVDNRTEIDQIEMSICANGIRDTCVFTDESVIKFEVSRNDGSHMSIESIILFRVKLGQNYWSDYSARYLRFGQFMVADDGIWLWCDPYVSAFYTFDESIELIGLANQEETRMEYLLMRLFRAADRLDRPGEPNLTMRLKYVAIGLHAIQEQLNVLGDDITINLSS